jgi:hypothetical protein
MRWQPEAVPCGLSCACRLVLVDYHNRVKEDGMQTVRGCIPQVRQKSDSFLLFPDEVVIYSLH